jgi:hypothetical protein
MNVKSAKFSSRRIFLENDFKKYKKFWLIASGSPNNLMELCAGPRPIARPIVHGIMVLYMHTLEAMASSAMHKYSKFRPARKLPRQMVARQLLLR